jgi:hypothetical protein
MSTQLPWLYLLIAGCSRSAGRSASNTPTLFQALALARHWRRHDRQPGLSGAGAEGSAGRHRLCGLDGIGAIGTVILGIVLFGEPATALRLACVGLIVAGIIGLKLVA